MQNDENFDEEFARAFAEIKELRETIVLLKVQMDSLEKRELLRVRGGQFCRACNGGMSHTGRPATPPISELEQKYHEANHATGAPADRSRNLSAFGPTVSWDDVERQVEYYRKAR